MLWKASSFAAFNDRDWEPSTAALYSSHPAASSVAAATRAACGFAVDLGTLQAQAAAHSVHPTDEAVLEGLRVQRGEDTVECVMRGDAILQAEEAGEPVLLGVAEQGDVVPGLGAAQNGAQGDDQDVTQQVPAG